MSTLLRSVGNVLLAAVLGAACAGFAPRSATAQTPQAPESPHDDAAREEARRLIRALGQPVDFDFDETPLNEALAELGRTHGVRILLDEEALRELDVSPERPITLRLSGAVLRDALEIIARRNNLVLTVENGALQLTSADVAYRRPAPQPVDRQAAEARIRRMLESAAIGWEFVETPLNEALDDLADAHGIPIVLDRRALRDADVRPDEPVTFHLPGVSLQSLLNVMLEQLDLAWVIEDEVLKVTTRTLADAKRETRRRAEEADLETRIYDVRLIAPHDGFSARLGRLIVATVEPASWQDRGGKGVLEAVDGILVVTHNSRVHDRVRSFLRELEDLAAETPAPPGLEPAVPGRE